MEATKFTDEAGKILPLLRPTALRLTMKKEAAEDLLQETFLRAYDQRDKFQQGSNLKAWMFTLMRNIFINNYQRMARRKTFLDSTDLQIFINTKPANESENVMNSGFYREDLKKALRKINTEQRKPFLMYFSGLKYDEIADKLRIPLGTVKTRIHNARIQLKKFLNEYDTAFTG